VPGSWIDEELRSRHADLLFTVPLHGRPTLVYVLLEHKAGSDRWTVLQVLRYVVRIYERWRSDHPDQEFLPLILPVLVHHGERPWQAPRRLAELLDLGDLVGPAREQLLAMQPQFALCVDDLAAIDEAVLRSRSPDAIAQLALLLLQQLPDVRELDPVAIVERWRDLFLALRRSPEWEFHGPRVFHYMYRRLETTLERLLAASDLLHDGRSTMAKSLADTLIEQGHAKGEAKGHARGKLELLQRLLTTRFGPLPDDVLDSLRAAPLERLDQIAERLFTASSLRELLA
jgi:hypothetical protein